MFQSYSAVRITRTVGSVRGSDRFAVPDHGPGWTRGRPESGERMGRHSKGRHPPQRLTIATVKMVDTSGTAHLVSVAAAADGLPRGTYATLCGTDVVPSAMVTREARHCRLCTPVPTQRSRGGR